MATKNNSDTKRFAYRSPTIKEPEAFFIPINDSTSTNLSKPVQPLRLSSAQVSSTLPSQPKIIRSADITTPRKDATTPARCLAVIRNPNHPQTEQGPVDLGDLGKSKSFDMAPVLSDGHKSVYFIRRPIALPESNESSKPIEQSKSPEKTKSVEFYKLSHESSPSSSLNYIQTPVVPTRVEDIPEQSQPISPLRSPPINSEPPTSPIRPENNVRYAPYLRRSQSKMRTPSPIHTNSMYRPPSPNQTRQKPTKQRSTLSKQEPQQQEPIQQYEDVDPTQGFYSITTQEIQTKPFSPPVPALLPKEEPVIQHRPKEELVIQNRPKQTTKRSQRKQSANERIKSAKSVVLVNPDDQSIVVIENSNVKGESLRPVMRRPKSVNKKQSKDDFSDSSTAKLVKTPRSQRCLGCLSRHMCLIILICIALILIGIAGVAVSSYFLASDSSTNLAAKIVGLVIGALLIIATLCFLCILLGCIGSRDGYFTYKGDESQSGGRAFALIPPSHPNAHLYIPSDYMRMVDAGYPPTTTQMPRTVSPNTIYNKPQYIKPVSAKLNQQQQTIQRSNSKINENEIKPNRSNITIEMPERLLKGGKISPKSRERSLNKVVKNIGYVVEDAKKRYNGDVPNKVIVTVDKNHTQAT